MSEAAAAVEQEFDIGLEEHAASPPSVLTDVYDWIIFRRRKLDFLAAPDRSS